MWRREKDAVKGGWETSGGLFSPETRARLQPPLRELQVDHFRHQFTLQGTGSLPTYAIDPAGTPMAGC
jgi:hypothetical protein